MRRLKTGVRGFDELVQGGLPEGSMTALVGPPGTGKTIFGIHFIYEGLKNGEPGIYVTTEETAEDIIIQAEQFGMKLGDFRNLIIISTIRGFEGWTLKKEEVNELLDALYATVNELRSDAPPRVVIDSVSTFWATKPAMSRAIAMRIRKFMYRYGITSVVTSQVSSMTGNAFGFSIEHIADGIVRFDKDLRKELRRMLIVEKMRFTAHNTRWHEVCFDEKGMYLCDLA